MKRSLKGAVLAYHPGPAAVVTLVSYLLASRLWSLGSSLGIALSVFLGQLVIGWSNDLIDFPSDLSGGRSEKPLVAGLINEDALRRITWITAVTAIVVNLLGPLGIKGGLTHLFGVACGVSYNFYFKRTLFSWLPYAIAFAALPGSIVIATNHTPPLWLLACGSLLGVAAHFANVVEDIDSDRSEGIRGLPQVLGERLSRAAAVVALMTVAVILSDQTQTFWVWSISATGAVVVLFGSKRFVFPALMVLALLDVVTLVIAVR
jgi:4-hydroxybenzoate polyprenyltransferase